MTVSPELAAYTAGLIDGEGSIQINAGQPKGPHGKRYWGLTVQVSTVAVNFLEPLRREWGSLGHICYHKRPARRDAVNWRCYSREAETLLRAVQPYLRLKKKHAKVAMRFLATRSPKRGSLTAKASRLRTKLAAQIRSLNAATCKASQATIVEAR